MGKLENYSFPKQHCGVTGSAFFLCIPTCYHLAFLQVKNSKFKIIVLRAISGTALALILTQCNICHLTAYKSMHITPWLHMTVS